MDKSEAIERLEYLKAKTQIALEQEVPEWIAEDVLDTIEAYDMAIEALQTDPNSSEKPNNCDDCIWSVCNYNKAFEDEPITPRFAHNDHVESENDHVEGKQKWTCARCGFENHADFKWCFKCGFHKPERSE